MQAHSAFHRHTFSIPNPSRRFTTSSPIKPVRPTPVSKLLFSAFAVTAAKTVVLNSHDGYGGGAGWLLIAFWGGRIVSEARHAWLKRVEGKGKEREGLQIETSHIALSFALAVQSILFVLALNAVGPLRATLLVTSGILAVNNLSSSWRSIATLLPVGLACLAVLGHLGIHYNVIACGPLVLLIAFTMLVHGNLSSALKHSKLEAGRPMALPVTAMAGSMATAAVFALWLADIIPAPLPAVRASSMHFLSAGTAILAYWLPLPIPSAIASKTSFRFRTTRDHVVLLASIFAFQAFAFRPQPTQLDALVIGPLAMITFALYEPPLPALKQDGQGWSYPAPVSTSRSWSLIKLLPPAWRPHVQTIVNTPSSSKIFYFLLLNLAYMGVQMAYGVLTNSLGLISDAIHMAFDCLGLAVGLWASVASTWKPDQQYTFGYGRVETLSGFANGCFLILISIFIIFEAIQRVMNPPKLMEIDRLLWVSSVGLAINLFGMWATGGHHHHGHGHGHDHGHGHSHHIAVNEKKVDHRHDEDYRPVVHRKGSQGFSHSVHASPPRQARKRSSQVNLKAQAQQEAALATNGHSHSHTDGHHHDHHDEHCDHSHSDSHGHSHDHHDHGHSYDHGHSHGHDHAHSHNMRGVFLHVLADTLGSVGVIISTILIKWTGWSGFDPLASIFIALLIVASVVPLVIDSGRVLCLDVGEGKEKEIQNALAELSSVEGLSNYGSPRFWPRCEGELVGSIHIHLAPSPSAYDPSKPFGQSERDRNGLTIYSNASKVVSRVERLLKSKIGGLSELVIQVEGGEDKPFCTCSTGR